MMEMDSYNAKLMRQAGFKKLYVLSDGYVWGRGDLRIATGSVKMSLNRLVEYIIRSAVDQTRKKTEIKFTDVRISN